MPRQLLFIQGGSEGAWAADAAERWPADVPLFLYHGDQDESVPVEHLDMYARALPQAVAWRLAGRDHQLGEEMTEIARDVVEVA